MNKLSKDKRDKLILVCMAIVGVLGALYTFVLGAQKADLAKIETQVVAVKGKLAKAETLMKNAPMIDGKLAESKKELDSEEETMVPQGQYYYWFLKVMDQFRKEQRLDQSFIVDITQPESIDAGLIPQFPYRAYSFGLRLNGQFHDVGRFIAELENTFPYYRVQNVKLAPSSAKPGALSAGTPGPLKLQPVDEKLTVELRVVALMKPGSS